MADNDEYQYTELDPLNPTVSNEDEGLKDTTAVGRGNPPNIKRNAIIAIVCFVCLMGIYKLWSAHHDEKIVTAKSRHYVPPHPPKPIPSPVERIVKAPIAPSLPVQNDVHVNEQSSIQSKLSELGRSQGQALSNISELSEQLASVRSNIDLLASKITALTGVMNTLNEKLDKQLESVSSNTAKPVEKVVRRHVRKKFGPPLLYYIQAVIPGRAWLVATNGSTVTVREGSRISGYGMVTLIDPNQGRVVTSSGRVIRFSQEDS